MVKIQGIRIGIDGCVHSISLEEARSLYLELKELFEPVKIVPTYRGEPMDWTIPPVTTES